jgi:hypothetical protein
MRSKKPLSTFLVACILCTSFARFTSKKASNSAVDVALGKEREIEMGRWRPKKADSLTSTARQHMYVEIDARRVLPSSRRWLVGATKGTLLPVVAVEGSFSFFVSLGLLPAPWSSAVAF